MGNSNRTTWLDKLLGRDKAENVRQDLSKAAALLDGAGVQRKEIDEKNPPEQPPQEQPPTPPESRPEDGNVVDRVAAKLASDVTAAVSGDYTQLTEDKLRALLVSAMEPDQSEAEPTAESTPPPAQEETQLAEDKSKSTPASPLPDGWDGERVKSLLETLVQQTEDQGGMAKSISDLNAELQAVKALLPKVSELVEWKVQVEQMLAMRPRASEDVATVIPDGDEAKALVEAINKGLQGPDMMFLGRFPVKQTPT